MEYQGDLISGLIEMVEAAEAATGPCFENVDVRQFTLGPARRVMVSREDLELEDLRR